LLIGAANQYALMRAFHCNRRSRLVVVPVAILRERPLRRRRPPQRAILVSPKGSWKPSWMPVVWVPVLAAKRLIRINYHLWRPNFCIHRDRKPKRARSLAVEPSRIEMNSKICQKHGVI
jgi:hypothetical protein